MLKDSFYAGFIEYQPWEVARRPGKHQGIISEETFKNTQLRLGNGNLAKKIVKSSCQDFALRGLTVCADCGGHLSAAWSKSRNGKKHPYYFCQNRKCNLFRQSLRRDNVEGDFKKLLQDTTLKEEVGIVVESVFEKVWKQEVLQLKKNERAQEESRRILRERISKLTDMILRAKSDVVMHTYEKQIEQSVKELEDLGNEESVIHVDLLVPYRTALSKSIGLLKSPYFAWEKLTTIEQQELFYFIFEEKLAYDKKEGYRTAQIPSAARLFEEFVFNNTKHVHPLGLEPRTGRV